MTLGEDESPCRAPDGAGRIPSLNPQKHALAELSIGGHPANVKSPSCACYISNASDQLNSLLRCPPCYGVGTGSCYQQVGSLNLASGCWVSSSKNRVSLVAVSQYYHSFTFLFANWPGGGCRNQCTHCRVLRMPIYQGQGYIHSWHFPNWALPKPTTVF